MRRVLFSLHLPKSKRVRADYAVLVELLRGLRDGDILNVCVHSIYEGGWIRIRRIGTAPPPIWVNTSATMWLELCARRMNDSSQSGLLTRPHVIFHVVHAYRFSVFRRALRRQNFGCLVTYLIASFSPWLRLGQHIKGQVRFAELLPVGVSAHHLVCDPGKQRAENERGPTASETIR